MKKYYLKNIQYLSYFTLNLSFEQKKTQPAKSIFFQVNDLTFFVFEKYFELGFESFDWKLN